MTSEAVTQITNANPQKFCADIGVLEAVTCAPNC